MTIDATAASLTHRFTGLPSAWPADDPALLDRSRLLLLDGLAVAVAGAAERTGPDGGARPDPNLPTASRR
jgi:aconitate decarboxylase